MLAYGGWHRYQSLLWRHVNCGGLKYSRLAAIACQLHPSGGYLGDSRGVCVAGRRGCGSNREAGEREAIWRPLSGRELAAAWFLQHQYSSVSLDRLASIWRNDWRLAAAAARQALPAFNEIKQYGRLKTEEEKNQAPGQTMAKTRRRSSRS